MSYIEDKITIKEYLDSIQDKRKKNHMKSILNQFDIFCKQKYEKSNQQIMDDLYEEQKNEDTKNKVYIVFNHFKNWMLIDHPEIVYFMGKKENQRRTIKKRHANTIVTYLKTIRAIFEEIGDIELSSRKFWSKIKVPKPEEDEPEPFTKEQMRLLLDRCSNQSKLKYMTMKDTSMRVSELVQITKRELLEMYSRYIKNYTLREEFIQCSVTYAVKLSQRKTQQENIRAWRKTKPYNQMLREIYIKYSILEHKLLDSVNYS